MDWLKKPGLKNNLQKGSVQLINVGKEDMNDLGEEDVSKKNRRKRLEAEEGAPIIHLPILNLERETPRKVRDRKLNLLVKRARKKS